MKTKNRTEQIEQFYNEAEFDNERTKSQTFYEFNKDLIKFAMILILLFSIFGNKSWLITINMIVSVIYFLLSIINISINIKFISRSKQLGLKNQIAQFRYMFYALLVLGLSVAFFLRTNLFM